jgi:protein-tyrosine-phosphatase
MAEAIFNALVEERGLAYRAASAGVAALENGDITPSARGARGDRNLQRGASREAGERGDAKEADLVLAISPRQWCSFAGASGNLSERVYTLTGSTRWATPAKRGPRFLRAHHNNRLSCLRALEDVSPICLSLLLARLSRSFS